MPGASYQCFRHSTTRAIPLHLTEEIGNPASMMLSVCMASTRLPLWPTASGLLQTFDC